MIFGKNIESFIFNATEKANPSPKTPMKKTPVASPKGKTLALDKTPSRVGNASSRKTASVLTISKGSNLAQRNSNSKTAYLMTQGWWLAKPNLVDHHELQRGMLVGLGGNEG